MSEKTGSEQVRTKNFKTRCYYTDYVNHMIRFYLTCPDVLTTAGKRKADIENWMAVQATLHNLKESDRQTVFGVFKAHFRMAEGVRIYCSETGADERRTWILLTKVASSIARRRGLI